MYATGHKIKCQKSIKQHVLPYTIYLNLQVYIKENRKDNLLVLGFGTPLRATLENEREKKKGDE